MIEVTEGTGGGVGVGGARGGGATGATGIGDGGGATGAAGMGNIVISIVVACWGAAALMAVTKQVSARGVAIVVGAVNLPVEESAVPEGRLKPLLPSYSQVCSSCQKTS